MWIISHLFCIPSKETSTLTRKSLPPKRANSFLLDWTYCRKELGVYESKQEVAKVVSLVKFYLVDLVFLSHLKDYMQWVSNLLLWVSDVQFSENSNASSHLHLLIRQRDRFFRPRNSTDLSQHGYSHTHFHPIRYLYIKCRFYQFKGTEYIWLIFCQFLPYSCDFMSAFSEKKKLILKEIIFPRGAFF